MNKFVMAAVTTVACLAVPAKSDETRVEARGGVVWADGQEEAIIGIAAGHDFHLDESVFVEIVGNRQVRDVDELVAIFEIIDHDDIIMPAID